MHPAEIEAALESMVITIDTREQDTPAFRGRVKAFPKWSRMKLDAGDYSARFTLPGGRIYRLPVAIERKMDFTELANCYCQQRRRFTAEFERAKAAGVKLYLLVEGESWESAYSGDYRSHMDPKALVASLLAWLARYDCQVIFCQRRTTGKLIRDILYREGKEALTRLCDSG